jgi:hypothetical protein
VFVKSCVDELLYVSNGGTDNSVCGDANPCRNIYSVLSIEGLELSVFIQPTSGSYSASQTPIANNHLNIVSSTTSPTTVVFGYTAATTLGALFNVVEGTLSARNVIFMYNNNAVDAVISVTGAGYVFLREVVVRSDTSTQASKPFVLASGAFTVDITGVTFANFSGTEGVVSVEGPGSLYVQEVCWSSFFSVELTFFIFVCHFFSSLHNGTFFFLCIIRL